MSWFVYILECNDNSYYVGCTNDLKRRLNRHSSGTASKYTRSRLPVRLAFYENQPNRSMALKREAEIKSWKRNRKKTLINSTEQKGLTVIGLDI